MVLSSRKARNPPTNMPVVSSTWMTWSSWRIPGVEIKVMRIPRARGPHWPCPWGGHSPEAGESPVWSRSGFLLTQLGMVSPQ